MKQIDRVLEYMQENGSITSFEAFHYIGCTRLAAQIFDLKKRGIRIKAETETAENRFGDKVSYKRYSLEGKDENG